MTERRHTNQRTGEVVDDPHIRPFADWLQEQSSGRTQDELSDALWDLSARVRETGKKGSLTLTVSVEPMKGDTTVLIVSDEIRLKLPEFTRTPSVFYSDDQGNLSRSNPDQPELAGLREVTITRADAEALKEANKS